MEATRNRRSGEHGATRVAASLRLERETDVSRIAEVLHDVGVRTQDHALEPSAVAALVDSLARRHWDAILFPFWGDTPSGLPHVLHLIHSLQHGPSELTDVPLILVVRRSDEAAAGLTLARTAHEGGLDDDERARLLVVRESELHEPALPGRIRAHLDGKPPSVRFRAG